MYDFEIGQVWEYRGRDVDNGLQVKIISLHPRVATLIKLPLNNAYRRLLNENIGWSELDVPVNWHYVKSSNIYEMLQAKLNEP